MGEFEEHQRRVRRERQELLEQWENGTFSMDKHLADHPISHAIQAGLRLRDDHPAMVLRRQRGIDKE